jgi:hypothetical protein
VSFPIPCSEPLDQHHRVVVRSLNEGVPASKILPLVISVSILRFLGQKNVETYKNHIFSSVYRKLANDIPLDSQK